MKKNLIFILHILLNSIQVVCQDTIYTVKGDTIIADITNVGMSYITYTDWRKKFAKQISRAKVSQVVRLGENKNLIVNPHCRFPPSNVKV